MWRDAELADVTDSDGLTGCQLQVVGEGCQESIGVFGPACPDHRRSWAVRFEVFFAPPVFTHENAKDASRRSVTSTHGGNELKSVDDKKRWLWLAHVRGIRRWADHVDRRRDGRRSGDSDGSFLYVQTGAQGHVDAFRVNADGSLSPIGSVTVPGAVGGEGIVAL